MKISKEVKDYFRKDFSSDLKAGFITSIVALPLAIAFAIASGVPPIMGLYTAIIAGILGSAFGGSNYSITGPTGAMSVIILSTVNSYGIEGLLLAGFIAGILQIFFGLMKLGKLIKFIPLPVIVGFTAGIGAIIFIGQIGNFLGLSVAPKERVYEGLIEIFNSLSNINYITLVISLMTILSLVFLPKIFSRNKFLKNVPVSIFALIFSSIAVFIFSLNVPTVGLISGGFPKISLINFNMELLFGVLPAAFTIALLGVIEALLCAVVCDAMTNTKHNSNKELIGQGIANVALPFFNAIPSTAAIARSAVNIKEGARTRVSGIIHSLIILIILLFLSPLAMYIPKAFLAGILMVVSIKMINLHEVKTVFQIGRHEAIVMSTTFILTVLTNLVFAVQIGMLMAIFLLFLRLINITTIKSMEEYDSSGELNDLISKDPLLKDKVAIYTIHGPFFFGAMNIFEQKINEHINSMRPIIIIRMKHVPFIDGTAQIQLLSFLLDRKKKGSRVIFTEFWPGVKESLHKTKEFKELITSDNTFNSVNQALEKLRKNKS